MKAKNSNIVRAIPILAAIIGMPLSRPIGAQALNFGGDASITFQDEAGVDLASGKPIKSYGNLSLGDAGSPAVDLTIFSTSHSLVGKTPIFGRYDYLCTTYGGVSGCIYYSYNWNVYGDSESYSWPTYPPQTNPPQVTAQGSQFSGNTLYRRDGTVWRFESGGTGARVSTVTYPDGTILSYTYGSDTVGGSSAPRLRSILSNRGYMMHFEGLNPVNGAIPSKVTLINLNVDYCAPTAVTCTGLTRPWPSVTYTNGSVNGVFTTTATDHLGRVSTRTMAISPTVIEGDWDKWYTTTRFTSPGGTWFEYQVEAKASRLPSGDMTRPCTARGLLSSLKNADGQWNYNWNAERRCFDVIISGLTSVGPDGSSRRIAGGDTYDELNRKTSYGSYGYGDGGFYGSINAKGLTGRVLPEGNQFAYFRDVRTNPLSTVVTAKDGTTTISQRASYPATCTLTTYKTCNNPDYTIDANGVRTDYTYYPAHGGIDTRTLPADKFGFRPKTKHNYQQLSARYKTSAGALTYGPPIWMLVSTSTCISGASCAGTDKEVITSFGYNDNLLPTTVTISSGDGVVLSLATTAYDEYGNVASVDGPLSGSADKTFHFYDGARQKTGEIGADPDGGGPLPRPAKSITYDADGRVKRETVGTTHGTDLAALNAMAVVNYVDTSHDAMGRPTRATFVSNGVVSNITQTSYDLRGRPVCVAQRMNPATFSSLPSSACTAASAGVYGPDRIAKTVYDAAGQAIQVIQGVGTSEERVYATRRYSANGRLTDVLDAHGNWTHFEYDGFDRLTHNYYPSPVRPTAYNAATPATAFATARMYNSTDFEQFGYDNNGNKLFWKRRDGTQVNFSFDDLNRQVLKDLPGTASDVYSRYDLNGNVTHRCFDLACTPSMMVKHDYDGLNRLMASTDLGGRKIKYGYNAAASRTRLEYPDGTYIGFDLDQVGRIKTGGWNSDVGLFGQTYSSLGDLISITKGGASTSISYDNAGRRTNYSNDFAGSANDVSWSFPKFNPADQVTEKGATSPEFDYKPATASGSSNTFDGLNRIEQIAALSGGYDARQNLAHDGVRRFTYDYENRLIGVTGGSTPLSLAYDPEGRLYKVTASSTDTYFLYDGVDLIGEYNSSGQLQRRFVHADGTDDPIVWLEGASNSDTRYFFSNYQGSIVAYANAAGTLQELYKYGPFGEPKNASDQESWSGRRFGFTGQVLLPEAKLYFYKARVYDPRLGIFLQTDPIGTEDDLNLYTYAGNDPFNSGDPSGLCEVDYDGILINCQLKMDPGLTQVERDGYRDAVIAMGQSIQDNGSKSMAKAWDEAKVIEIGPGKASDPATGQVAFGRAEYKLTRTDIAAGNFAGKNGTIRISSDLHVDAATGGINLVEFSKTFFHEIGHGTPASMQAAINGDVDRQESIADLVGIQQAQSYGSVPMSENVRLYTGGGANAIMVPALISASILLTQQQFRDFLWKK